MAIRTLRNTLFALFIPLSACSAESDKSGLSEWRALDSITVASYDFVNVAADTIIDPTGSLAPFFSALDSIASGQSTVSIIHFGDSHIQGGTLTANIMRRFARQYGTAGRGFITPHRLTGKNEPRDYSITASPKSSGGFTIVDNESRTKPIGISGVAANCPSKIEFTIQSLSLPDDPTDYRFSRIVAFHDSLAPLITACDEQLLDDAGGSDIFNSFSTELNLLSLTDSFRLRTYAEGEFNSGSIYGFSLENGKPGVLYHSIGVNSACFLHWGRQGDVVRQATALQPRLIIISLGSNEASGNNLISTVLTEQMDSFILPLQAANPGVPILLVTPAESMRRQNRTQIPNTNFSLLRATMKQYAKDNDLALFDLYGATAEAGSAIKWKEASLLARDGIHYTAEGYALQGILIYNAIQNEAKRYAKKH